MEIHEYIAYFFMVFLSFYLVYKAFTSLEKENKALKDRNWLLAHHLQLAELRTGVPYYSSVASQSVPGELNKHFFRALQERIQNDVPAPAPQPARVYEDEPVHMD